MGEWRKSSVCVCVGGEGGGGRVSKSKKIMRII